MNTTQLANCIMFSLALNSSPDQVNEVVDRIYDFFKIENTGTVAPASIAAQPVATGIFSNNTLDGVNTITAPTGAISNAPIDKNGLPWDERIHASTKALSQDGTWRARRGVMPDFKARVEKELQQTMGTAAVTSVVPAPVAATAPLPTMPGLPPIPGATVVAEETPYTKFVSFLTENTQSPSNPTGRLTPEWIKAALLQYGIAEGSLQNLAHRADLIPTIEAGVRQSLGL